MQQKISINNYLTHHFSLMVSKQNFKMLYIISYWNVYIKNDNKFSELDKFAYTFKYSSTSLNSYLRIISKINEKKIMNLFNVYENSKKVLSRKNLFYEEIYLRN